MGPTRKFQLITVLGLTTMLLTTVVAAGTEVVAQAKLEPTSGVKVSIETSRPRITAGPSVGFGIIAQITNVHDRPIRLDSKTLRLAIPGELGWFVASSNALGIYHEASFVTEENLQEPIGSRNLTITIPSGDTYPVFFYVSPATAATWWEDVRSWLYFMTFSPGDYRMTIVGKYHIEPGKAGKDEGSYRLLRESVTLPVAAPTGAILLGSAIGGLIAYLIFPEVRQRIGQGAGPKSRVVEIGRKVAGVLASLLLSIIVTILLSRISETQFLVRVTVNDLWGAIAIGFVANYAGTKIIAYFVTTDRARRGREQ